MPQTKRKPPSPEPRRPYHVGVLIGVSTGMYALSLAAVTTLQVSNDRALIEERQPVQDAIGLLADHHDQMTTLLDDARRRYDEARNGYDGLADQLADVRDDVARLGRLVKKIEGSAVSLPADLDLPPVPRIAAPRPAPPPPPTHATTGASGKP